MLPIDITPVQPSIRPYRRNKETRCKGCQARAAARQSLGQHCPHRGQSHPMLSYECLTTRATVVAKFSVTIDCKSLVEVHTCLMALWSIGDSFLNKYKANGGQSEYTIWINKTKQGYLLQYHTSFSAARGERKRRTNASLVGRSTFWYHQPCETFVSLA